MRRLLGLCAGLIVCPAGVASPAVAAKLSIQNVGPGALRVAGDGARYIATSGGTSSTGPTGPVTITDVTTGRSKTVPTLAGCHFTDISVDNTLLWNCDPRTTNSLSSGLTYNFATGAIAMLKPQPPSTDADGAQYGPIGRRWVRVEYGLGGDSYVDYIVNRATGEQVATSPSRDEVPDLDSELGVRTLCAGMRRPLVPDTRFGLEPGPLAIAGRLAAATTSTDHPGRGSTSVVLQGCGRRQKTLEKCTVFVCYQPVINSRIVAWIDYRQRTTGIGLFLEQTNDVRLRVYSIATKRTRTLKLTPVLPNAMMLLAHRFYLATPSRLRRVKNSGA